MIDGCEVCAYWSFRHRLLHQTNNSYRNIHKIELLQSCYRDAAHYKSVHCMQSVSITNTKCVMARGGEVRGGSLEVVEEGGGGGGR